MKFPWKLPYNSNSNYDLRWIIVFFFHKNRQFDRLYSPPQPSSRLWMLHVTHWVVALLESAIASSGGRNQQGSAMGGTNSFRNLFCTNSKIFKQLYFYFVIFCVWKSTHCTCTYICSKFAINTMPTSLVTPSPYRMFEQAIWNRKHFHFDCLVRTSIYLQKITLLFSTIICISKEYWTHHSSLALSADRYILRSTYIMSKGLTTLTTCIRSTER